MDKITSTANPVVKRLRSLRDAKAREECGEFLVEGEVMILEALKCGLSPSDALLEDESALISALEKAGARAHLASRNAIEAACDTKTPQGSCAAFTLPRRDRLPENASLLVALDGVQDPGNLGTIWRTADASGFHALILGEGCADPYSPKVQRAAMGSGFRVPLLETRFPEALQALQRQGFRVVVSALDGEPLYEHPFSNASEKLILVIGNEAHGVSKAVQSLADVRLKIPMRGGAESLNASVAAGILMYELTRNTLSR